MTTNLLVVTGAPGAGKTTAAEQLLTMPHEFVVFDIDWLIKQGSDLIGQPIQESPDSWKPWAHLWFEVLHSVIRNGKTPIFFCPNTPEDFLSYGLPEWCQKVDWLLLDCESEIRTARLLARGWSEISIEAALADAGELRDCGFEKISTDVCSKSEVAAAIIRWANDKRGQDG